ncbi:winged helix-turn-helix domain-containing protein [Ralstonia soli]|uniref:Winged helix DNA-binding protein n=1 Tax=Ralstonia soli TaxID=2953896 RepID=A0ABT1ADY1_9RALS|nr:winged helix DNA-binding protein [Ralstonia soli]MCO5396615.1 winged helix DNA-binding protein [Ralstonia soli]
MAELSPMERKAIIVLNLSEGYVSYSNLCFSMGVTEQHLVTYAVRKLEQAGLVLRRRQGKFAEYCLTEYGRRAGQNYWSVLLETSAGLEIGRGKDIEVCMGEVTDLFRLSARSIMQET